MPNMKITQKMKRSATATALGLVLSMAGLSGLSAANMDHMSEMELAQSLNTVYQQLQKNPKNTGLLFRAAEILKRLGDRAGALKAYDQILEIDPSLARVHLEKGLLQYSTGDLEGARASFQTLLGLPGLSTEVRSKVEGYIEQLDKKLARSVWGGSVLAGLQYQSNPTFASDNTFGTANTPIRFNEEEDFNAYGMLVGYNSYDIGERGDAVWETSGQFYGSAQFEQDQLNLLYIEGKTGIRFDFLPTTLRKATMKPYVVTNYLNLDGENYSLNFGGGFAFAGRSSQTTSWTTSIEARNRTLWNSPRAPRAEEQEGYEIDLKGGMNWKVSPALSFSLDLGFASGEADQDWYSYIEPSVKLGMLIRHGRILSSEVSASSRFDISYEASQYDAPDPNIDPNNEREDDRVRATWNFSLPVSKRSAVLATFGYTNVSSDVAFYEYDNTQIGLGFTHAF